MLYNNKIVYLYLQVFMFSVLNTVHSLFWILKNSLDFLIYLLCNTNMHYNILNFEFCNILIIILFNDLKLKH